MKAIILAAGYATRLYPLTENMPKALLPIGNKPMLNYLVDQLATLKGLTEVHIVTNHRFAKHFEDWCAAQKYALKFFVWDDGTTNNDNRLGAVGDIKYVLDHADIDDDVLVAASDNFFTFPLTLFEDYFNEYKCDTLLAGYMESIEERRRFAIATFDEEGYVNMLVEKPKDPPSDMAVYALYIYRKDTLPLIGKYIAEGNNPDAPGHFPEWLVKRGRKVRAYRFEGECIDIGTVESYREICERFSEK